MAAIAYTHASETIHEHLDDIVFISSPVDTPLLSLLDHRTVHNPTFSWTMDDIATPSSVAGVEEGTTPTVDIDSRDKATNVAMIYHRAVLVSDSQRYAMEAGIEEEFSWSVVKEGLRVLKQQEFNLHWSDYQARAGSTIGRTAGLVEWAYLTGSDSAAAATVAGESVGATYSATFWDYSGGSAGGPGETNFHNNLLQPAWSNGQSIPDSVILCGGNIKNMLSDFGLVYNEGGTPLTRSFIDAEKKKRIHTVDIYESDYGPISIALDRYMDDTTVHYTAGAASSGGGNQIIADESLLMIDPSYCWVGVYRPLSYSPLAKTRDATEGYVVMECGLGVGNPKSISLASELTT